uniref:Type I restriction endonuclease subunit R n=1 Tax=Heterorhabditis bacteriophora TaxID=37862 RepID=A0A1I7WTJ2_HETBA
MPRLEKPLKNREENSPANLRSSESSKLIIRALGNLPLDRELLRSFPPGEFATRTVEKWRTPLFLNGTDPSLVIPLRMTYTTRLSPCSMLEH